MPVSFEQLLELLNSTDCEVSQLRFFPLSGDILHAVLYLTRPEKGTGELFLTLEQMEKLKKDYPSLTIIQTGTFPIPKK